jgi:hypothetical protein
VSDTTNSNNGKSSESDGLDTYVLEKANNPLNSFVFFSGVIIVIALAILIACALILIALYLLASVFVKVCCQVWIEKKKKTF